MTCQEFLARHSDFIDGELDAREYARVEAHRASCPKCARYDRVVRSGVRMLRGLPEVEPSSDFFPRLQHRIYNLDERLRSGHRGTSAGAVASLAVAASLALLAWSPLLRSGLEVRDVDAVEQAASASPGTPSIADPGPSRAAPFPGAAARPTSGVTVQLAAEAPNVPSIDPRPVQWSGAFFFDESDAMAQAWWWVGATAPMAAPSLRRSTRLVDLRTPGPYSPLIVEAPTFRRTSIPSRAGSVQFGRD